MKKVLPLFLFLVLVLTCPVQAATDRQPDSTVTVAGHAEVAVVPDTAYISVGIVTLGTDVATAKNSADTIMANILATTTALGIPKENVRTAGFSIHPQYKQSGKYDEAASITGYQVQNTVTITVSDFSLISAVIDSCAQAGANQIHSLRFALRDESKLKDQLLEKAVRDGKAKAELIADTLGTSLGKPLSILSGSYNSPSGYDTVRIAKSASSSTPISAGTVTLAADVTMVFLLK